MASTIHIYKGVKFRKSAVHKVTHFRRASNGKVIMINDPAYEIKEQGETGYFPTTEYTIEGVKRYINCNVFRY